MYVQVGTQYFADSVIYIMGKPSDRVTRTLFYPNGIVHLGSAVPRKSSLKFSIPMTILDA